MTEAERQLEAARAVKEKAAKLMERHGQVMGVGITRLKGVYAVKVNLEEEPIASEEIPQQIDGVPLVVRAVGKIRKQQPTRKAKGD